MSTNNTQNTSNPDVEDAEAKLTADQLMEKYGCVTLEEFNDMMGYEIVRQYEDKQ